MLTSHKVRNGVGALFGKTENETLAFVRQFSALGEWPKHGRRGRGSSARVAEGHAVGLALAMTTQKPAKEAAEWALRLWTMPLDLGRSTHSAWPLDGQGLPSRLPFDPGIFFDADVTPDLLASFTFSVWAARRIGEGLRRRLAVARAEGDE